MPHGYEVVIFEQYEKSRRPDAHGQYPRVPPTRQQVLDDETYTIINMGVDIRYSAPVKSMKALLAEKFDAIFIGSGALHSRKRTGDPRPSRYG